METSIFLYIHNPFSHICSDFIIFIHLSILNLCLISYKIILKYEIPFGNCHLTMNAGVFQNQQRK